jgi:hypothetical protein
MYSRIIYFFSVLLLCYTSFFFYPRWKQAYTNATISWDVSGYYWYLPSMFIYHDLKGQSFKDSILIHYRPTNTDFQQAMKLDNGNYVMKYSSGMAVMYFPFFITAHLLAKPLGFPADGFSAPYQFAIQLGGFLISILGLWYLRKLLLLFYTDRVVAVVLLLLALGSNYLNYAAVDNGMSHCWLFTIYVLLILNTCFFYRDFKIKYAVRIGLLVGLATLTRPTDIISCLIPLLWGMEGISIAGIEKLLNLLWKNVRPFMVAVVCAGCMISIQLVYWKYASGHWFVYSYGDQGFSWLHPHALLYSFNYRSGWFNYAPMMLLGVAGFVPFMKHGRNRVALISFFVLNYYIVCAWDIWWYGGRAMVQSYPVLLFPMASLVDAAFKKRVWLWIFTPLAVLFIYFNIWITWQYHIGKLYDADAMTKAYYLRVLGRWTAPERTLELRDNTELYEGPPRDMKLVYQDDFEHDTGAAFTKEAISGGQALVMNKERQVSPFFSFPFTGAGAEWLRVQGTFRIKNKEWDVWKMPQFVVRLIDKNKGGNDKIVKENMIRVARLLDDNETRDIAIDIKLPDRHYDSVSIWFWNADSDKELIVDDIKAWTF